MGGQLDFDIGTGVVIGCWFLTASVGIALILRYTLKTWIRWFLPRTFVPDKVWGLEDLLVFAGYGFDIIHMTTLELSSRWGLGRPFQYLGPFEQAKVLRYGHISQPFGVTAGMISRTGMAWTLLTCFANRRMRLGIFACIVVQVVINTVVVLQSVLQCGPHPYFPANRLEHFHFMWDALPADGSVKCQSPSVNMTIGFVQGGFNATVDFLLAAIAVIEIWQFFFQILQQNPGVSFWSQLRDISGCTKVRRALQTVAISGLLLLAGAASIVKAYYLKSNDDRSGFSYNMVDIILWTKIENTSILLASCAHTSRLLRVLMDYYREGQYTGYFSDNNRTMEMRHCRDKSISTVDSDITLNDMGYYRQSFFGQSFPRRYESQACRATPPTHVLNDCVTVVTDFIVEVNKRQSRGLHSSGGQFRPERGSFKDEEARVERYI